MRRKPGALVPLEASVLVVAAELFARGIAEIHGYDLARHLAERTHARLLTSHGTLYRALSRLESMGLLDSRWESTDRDDPTRPPRRLYRLSEAGAERALERRCRGRRRPRGAGARPRGGTRVSRDPFAIAAALVRGWTRVYTCTVDPAVRQRRRAEIDADLWSAAQDDTRERSAITLLLRAGGGLLDDVAWVFEQPQHLASIRSALGSHRHAGDCCLAHRHHVDPRRGDAAAAGRTCLCQRALRDSPRAATTTAAAALSARRHGRLASPVRALSAAAR